MDRASTNVVSLRYIVDTAFHSNVLTIALPSSSTRRASAIPIALARPYPIHKVCSRESYQTYYLPVLTSVCTFAPFVLQRPFVLPLRAEAGAFYSNLEPSSASFLCALA
jgi:hypothetical protein